MAGNLEDSIIFLCRIIEDPKTDLDSIKIELGKKDDRIERGRDGSWKIPKAYYENMRIKLRGEKNARKLRESTARKKQGEYIDEGNRDIDSIFSSRDNDERKRETDKAVANYSNTPRTSSKKEAEKRKRAKKRAKRRAREEKKAKKRNLKNKTNKDIKISNQKEITGRRIKALVESLILSVGLVAGGVALENYVSEYNETAQEVKELSVGEIKDLARREFLEALSHDTSVPAENIKITKTSISSSEEKTEITFSEGEEETTYTLTENSRDPINYGKISGNISRIYTIIENSSNEREAINALMKERDFVKKNKINKGKEISTETRPTETKSSGSQDMDEHTL